MRPKTRTATSLAGSLTRPVQATVDIVDMNSYQVLAGKPPVDVLEHALDLFEPGFEMQRKQPEVQIREEFQPHFPRALP